MQGLPHLATPLLLSLPLSGAALLLLAEHAEEAAEASSAAGEPLLPGGLQLAERLLVRQGELQQEAARLQRVAAAEQRAPRAAARPGGRGGKIVVKPTCSLRYLRVR